MKLGTRAIQSKKERAVPGSRARVCRAEATAAGVRVLARWWKLGFWDQLGSERMERSWDWVSPAGGELRFSRVSAAEREEMREAAMRSRRVRIRAVNLSILGF